MAFILHVVGSHPRNLSRGEQKKIILATEREQGQKETNWEAITIIQAIDGRGLDLDGSGVNSVVRPSTYSRDLLMNGLWGMTERWEGFCSEQINPLGQSSNVLITGYTLSLTLQPVDLALVTEARSCLVVIFNCIIR